jgi:hypothetical protein
MPMQVMWAAGDPGWLLLAALVVGGCTPPQSAEAAYLAVGPRDPAVPVASACRNAVSGERLYVFGYVRGNSGRTLLCVTPSSTTCIGVRALVGHAPEGAFLEVTGYFRRYEFSGAHTYRDVSPGTCGGLGGEPTLERQPRAPADGRAHAAPPGDPVVQ